MFALCTATSSLLIGAAPAARLDVKMMADRVFSSANAKGGIEVDPKRTAVLFIEYQNEFTSDGGKLHEAVKGTMGDMLHRSAVVADTARAAGATVMHAPISFKEDASDNPNKALGILAGCAGDKLFTEGTWNADFCESMRPHDGDIIVQGKKGLDTFPGTDLESQLTSKGIETVALAGFLTNCCVESTMRSAYEKGFNVITLTDCTATTSAKGQNAATTGTYVMFSTPMPAVEFISKLSS